MSVAEWKERIIELVLLKQKIQELDSKQLWQHHLPALAATEADLVAVETRLGERLDAAYRGFLSCAGGWRAFFQTVDLFGPKDLMGSAEHAHAIEMLSYIDDAVLASSGFRREDLLPIAASPVDLDLFVLAKRASAAPGTVLWLAGAEVERFHSFDEFFASMVEYNRLEIQNLLTAARRTTS